MALELAIAGYAFYSPRIALAGLWAGVYIVKMFLEYQAP